MTDSARIGKGADPGWLRRYPPMLGMLLALSLVVLVLPSALHTPQSNPTTTPEFAPIPPDGDNATPPGGNVASLGLAGSSSLNQGAADAQQQNEDLPTGTGNLAGRGKTPSTKNCVGTPPRQTEDPLAPPCVADFRGDNGGATYQGVTRDEVRVLIYAGGGGYNTGDSGIVTAEPHTYVDLLKPPEPGEHVVARLARVYQQYFNDRYQSYGRFVHLFVYFNDPNVNDAPSRRADAADNYAVVHPFAVITALINSGNEEPYIEEMAKRGVLNFGSFGGRSQTTYTSHPGLVWGYKPSMQQLAERFTAMVCKEVTPYPASFSGNPLDNGNPRRLGLLYTTDPTRPPGLPEAIKAGLAKSNVQFDDEEALPYADDTQGNANGAAAAAAVATFQQKRVSTVIWAVGFDTAFSHAAAAGAYQPELVIMGDGRIESTYQDAVFQDQSVWSHAWVVTAQTYYTTYMAEQCYQAYRQIDDQENGTNIYWYACELTYASLRQLFTGIQVAGPRLTPATVDQGFHAIPALSSTNNRVSACFYQPGDFTCVKDSVIEWWDATGNRSTSGGGCWKMTRGGKRWLLDDWPDGEITTHKGPNDFCNQFAAIF